MSTRDNEVRSTFESTTGGVMTVEAGAVTGELELATYPYDDGLHVNVRYAGAGEWYTVEGAPVAPEKLDPAPRNPHECVLQHLKKPGPVTGGNEMPVSLIRFSSSGEA